MSKPFSSSKYGPAAEDPDARHEPKSASQLADAIERKFQEANQADLRALRHPSNPELRAISMFDILPCSAKEDKLEVSLITFDTDVTLGRSVSLSSGAMFPRPQLAALIFPPKRMPVQARGWISRDPCLSKQVSPAQAALYILSTSHRPIPPTPQSLSVLARQPRSHRMYVLFPLVLADLAFSCLH